MSDRRAFGMTIVGILLAAGRGVRFGADKRMALVESGPDRGVPVAVACCRHLRTALPSVVAVVRADDADLAARLRGTGATVVECARADEGMGASLACGVAASRDAAGWLVVLADMPWIRPSTFTRVAQALVAGASIAAPFYGAQRGHPVGFGASQRAALLALAGDEGGRGIVAANPTSLARIPVDDPGILRDVDRPGDLRSG